MSFPKILVAAILILGSVFVFYNWPKKQPALTHEISTEIAAMPEAPVQNIPVEEELCESPILEHQEVILCSKSNDADLPKDVDRMAQLFQPYPPLLPIVETVSYASKVSWLTGRASYLGDYASYYQTSKHFISRSLKGPGHYLSETVSHGDRFNVFRKDKEIQFHLVLDLSRLKLWVYCYDEREDQRILLKTYPVCAGKLDPKKSSLCLTPTGLFTLGGDIAVYKPGIMGLWRQEKKELISIFGVRWIPLQKEIANCTGSCKGLGFHGVPWKQNPQTGEYIENRECIGHYESGGCIRLLTEDIEELFAVVVSKPTYVHIVSDFQDATLPGKEI